MAAFNAPFLTPVGGGGGGGAGPADPPVDLSAGEYTPFPHADDDDFNTLDTAKWRFLNGYVYAAACTIVISSSQLRTPVENTALIAAVKGEPFLFPHTLHWTKHRRNGWIYWNSLEPGSSSTGFASANTTLTPFGNIGCVWVRVSSRFGVEPAAFAGGPYFGIALSASLGDGYPDPNNALYMGWDQGSPRFVAGEKLFGSGNNVVYPGDIVGGAPPPTLYGFQKLGFTWRLWCGWDDGNSVYLRKIDVDPAINFQQLTIFGGAGPFGIGCLRRTDEMQALPW